MARTPQYTAQQVEAQLGTRGSIRITSANRKLAKQWLTANGFPAAFVAGLSLMELQIAYNETDGSGLKKIQSKLDRAKEDGDIDNGDIQINVRVPDDANHIADQEALVRAVVPPVAPPANAHDATAIGILRDLILNGYKPGIDANEVRAIVQEQLAGVAPRVIECEASE